VREIPHEAAAIRRSTDRETPERCRRKLHRLFFGIGSGGVKKHKSGHPKPMTKTEKKKSAVSPRALKIDDACAYLGGISRSTLRRMVSRGLITPCRPTRITLFEIGELDRALIASRIRFESLSGSPSQRAAAYEAAMKENGE
jgi:hypothetical protein